MEQGLFYAMSALLIFFSLKVVTTKNLFHSVMSAFAVLMATAGMFFLLNAEFLGITQILIYAGAVTILVLFVVMLTSAGRNYEVTWEKPSGFWNFLFVVLFGGLLGLIVFSVEWPTAQPAALTKVTNSLAERIFLEYLLPFEVASILLLAALIGAIVLARRDER